MLIYEYFHQDIKRCDCGAVENEKSEYFDPAASTRVLQGTPPVYDTHLLFLVRIEYGFHLRFSVFLYGHGYVLAVFVWDRQLRLLFALAAFV